MKKLCPSGRGIYCVDPGSMLVQFTGPFRVCAFPATVFPYLACIHEPIKQTTDETCKQMRPESGPEMGTIGSIDWVQRSGPLT
jgi:hypothetical protein